MMLELFPIEHANRAVPPLRDYQETAVQAVLREWQTVQATLGVAATGLGKTTIFSELIKRTGKRALVLAHRQELVFQARARLVEFGIRADIEMGERRASVGFHKTPAVVATVQTMFARNGDSLRMTRFDPNEFGIVIADEAHHFTAPSFLAVLKWFRQNSDCKLLGVTATPDRADNEALSQVFESVAFNIEITDGIEFGYLVPIHQQLVRIESLDFSQCRTTAGDLNGADLARVMEAEKTLHGVADATLKIAGAKRTLVFAASVPQAEMLCEIFNRHRPGIADWIHAGTPDIMRAEKLRRFADGRTQIMVNCQVLTEGYDNPGIEVVVMARPTKSRCLYAQMIGRGTRPLPGVVDNVKTAEERRAAIAASAKPHLLVLDFVGNSGRHKLITTADILGGRISEEAKALAKKRIEQSGTARNIGEELRRAEAEIAAEIEKQKQKIASEKAHVIGRAKFSVTYIDPFDVFRKRAQKWEGYRQRFASRKQIALVRRLGHDTSRLTQQQIIRIWWEHCRATDRQRAVLYRYYDRNLVDKMTKWEASECIAALQRNGWRRFNENKPVAQGNPS